MHFLSGWLQLVSVSSQLSPQSLSPSHCHVSGMQRPLGQRTLQLWSDPGHYPDFTHSCSSYCKAPQVWFRQKSLFSSALSPQSSYPSQRSAGLMQMFVYGQRRFAPRQLMLRPLHVWLFSSETPESWQSLWPSQIYQTEHWSDNNVQKSDCVSGVLCFTHFCVINAVAVRAFERPVRASDLVWTVLLVALVPTVIDGIAAPLTLDAAPVPAQIVIFRTATRRWTIEYSWKNLDRRNETKQSNWIRRLPQ